MEHTQAQLYEMQRNIERDMAEEALRREAKAIKEAEQAGEFAATQPGNLAINIGLPTVSRAIAAYAAENASKKCHRWAAAYQYIKDVDPDVLAGVVLYKVVGVIFSHNRLSLTSLGMQIGAEVNREIGLLSFREQEPGLFRVIYKAHMRDPIKGRRHGLTALMHALRKKDEEFPDWPRDVRLKVGLTLFDIFMRSTKWVETVKRRGKQRHCETFVVPTESFVQWAEGLKSLGRGFTVNLPMIVPPVKWEGPVGGGYLSGVDNRLITGWKRTSTALLAAHSFPDLYEALNTIQETAFSVNTRVLDVIEQCVERNLPVGSLPAMFGDEPVKPKEWEAMSEDEQRAWKRAKREYHEGEMRTRGKRVGVKACITTAREYSKFERIYFPACLDFRGRLYYASSTFNPQGPDYIRSMLKFANGVPLGEHGMYHLALHGANCYGFDKVSLDDRVQFILDTEGSILEWARDPMEHRGWMEAEDPFQFLAFCFEWYAAFLHRSYGGSPSTFVSHLPVAMDGSCNGIQHLSALLKDEVGGAAVNLVPSDKPADIYAMVADALLAKLEHIAGGGDLSTPADIEFARTALTVGIDRKLVKRSVMTLPYGVTLHSVRTYLHQEITARVGKAHPFREVSQYRDRLQWLTFRLWDAISTVVVAGRQLLDWLQDVAKACWRVDPKKPLSWVTPLGFPVVQNYKRTVAKRVNILVADARYQSSYKEDVPDGSCDVRKSMNGVVPNFIHSLDASHMYMTVNMCSGAGIKDYLMVHDSYACPAGHAGLLGVGIREAFRQLYSGSDILGEFVAEVERNYPGVVLPPRPREGNLDLNRLFMASYFFA